MRSLQLGLALSMLAAAGIASSPHGEYVFPEHRLPNRRTIQTRRERGFAPDLTKRVITNVYSPEPLTKRQRRRLRGKAKGRG